jgi:hypothetical protein
MNAGSIKSPAPFALRRIVMWSAIAAILVAPLVAMQFTREVAWTGYDFAFAAMLLGGGGLACEAAGRVLTSAPARLVAGGVLLAAVLLVWADGAVGIF